jgi:hypothetical protein
MPLPLSDHILTNSREVIQLLYASIDQQNLAAVTQDAKQFGVTAVRDQYAAARVTTRRLQRGITLAGAD